MAADSRVSYDDGLYCPGLKIIKNVDGFIVAGCGSMNAISVWLRWGEQGMPPDEQPEHLDKNSTIMVVEPNGQAHVFEGAPVRQKLRTKKWAIGSGAHLAIGAMAMGADARKAVQVAAKFDMHTGGKILAYTPGVKVK